MTDFQFRIVNIYYTRKKDNEENEMKICNTFIKPLNEARYFRDQEVMVKCEHTINHALCPINATNRI